MSRETTSETSLDTGKKPRGNMTMKHHFVRAALFAAISAGAPLAISSPAMAAPDDALIEMARERFQEGVQFYDKGEYEKARLSFLQAYSLKKHPAVLLNLAQSELRSGHDVSAATHFAFFLRENQSADKLERKEAERGLAGAKTKVAEVKVSAKKGAEIFVDGAPEGQAPLGYALYLAPGRHQIEARLAGAVDTESPMLSAGQSAIVAVGVPQPAPILAPVAAPVTEPALPPAPAPIEAAPIADPAVEVGVFTEPEVSDPGVPKENPLEWAERQPYGLAYVGAGVGAAGLITGLITGIAASSRYANADDIRKEIVDEWDTRPGSPCRNPTGDYVNACNVWTQEASSGDNLRTAAVVSTVVGVAATAGTVVWYFLDRKPLGETGAADGSSDFAVIPSVDTEGAGLTVIGSF